MGSVIFSFYMINIPSEVVEYQRKVIESFTDIPFFQLLTYGDHGHSIDQFIKKTVSDIYILFDIDCIPLNKSVIERFVSAAKEDRLIGCAQRFPLIKNNKHIYVAPCAMAFSRKLWETLGCPSFCRTDRGDVAEEMTFKCEEKGIPISYLMPTHVVKPLIDLVGEYKYGFGTTYDNDIFHAFRIRQRKTKDMFLTECKKVLGNKV